MALEAGFSVPHTFLVRTETELLDYCDNTSFPVILKPANCVPVSRNRVSKCRNWICANRDEVQRARNEWRERVPLLVQPFIAGIGEGIFGLVAPDGIRAWSAHRRLRMMNPQGSGSSACISQPVPQELTPAVEKLLQKGLWRGLFMIELLRDRSGKLWFVELNGRPWGSMALSRRQGFEYPAWHLRLALDQQSRVGTASPAADGVVCRNIGREIMHLLFVLRGPKSKALRDWPSFWKTLREVARVRRGDALYNWRREDPKVFIADCCYTIRSNVFKTSH
jgi:predicted ATP-grasp superfamily ATP-dependent carboligase